MSKDAATKSNGRLQEGALSPLTTPSNPPAATKLVPLAPPSNSKPPKGKA